MDLGAGKGRVEEAFYQERDFVVLQRFYRLRMDDLGAVIGHFDDLIVVQLPKDDGIRELFRVRVHDALDILPDREAFGAGHGGKNGSGIIAAFAAEGSTFVFSSGADKPLRYDHFLRFEKRQYLAADLLSRIIPVDGGVTEVGVGTDDVPNVDPLVADPGFGEVGAHDAGGQQFTHADDLVVIIIEVPHRLVMQEPLDLGKKIFQLSGGRKK